MLKQSLAALALCAFFAAPAFAAEPILGKWRSPDGGVVDVSRCGGSYCATVVRGKHKGKSVGRVSGSDGHYNGTVTDPRDDKTYDGSATVSDGRLTLKGCALGVLCKTQSWTRV